MSITFITYESCKSSYLETYFLPLYDGLSKLGHKVTIVCLTPPCQESIQDTRHSEVNLVRFQISPRRFLSLIQVAFEIFRITSRQSDKQSSMFICRSYLPALLSLPSIIFRRSRKSFVYDCDGIASLEALEFRSKSQVSYFKNWILKLAERFFVYISDGVISRSIETFNYYSLNGAQSTKKKRLVLDNCRELTDFLLDDYRVREFEITGDSLEVRGGPIVFCHLGSIGEQYLLFEEVTLLENVIKHGVDCHLLIVNNLGEEQLIGHLLANTFVPYTVVRSEPSDVPKFLRKIDVGFSLRASSPSMRHVKPLKSREYLFAGKPIVYSSNTADGNRFPPNISYDYSNIYSDFTVFMNWLSSVTRNSNLTQDYCRNYAIQNFNLDLDIRRLEAFSKLLLKDKP